MKALVILFCLALTACNNSIDEWTSNSQPMTHVKGLEDCHFISIDQGAKIITVIRCPNNDVTVNYKLGKATYNNSVTSTDIPTP